MDKIPVPADVLEGLEAVRTSGKTNMLDVPMVIKLALEMGVPMVIKLALEMGFPETALWVRERQALYVVGVFKNFVATDRLDEDILQDMAARFLDGEGGER